MADECCAPRMCEKHGLAKGSLGCDRCRSELYEEQEAAAFAKAKKVPLAEYTGEWLYREGFGNEGYFDADDTEEQESDDGPISWAWGCSEETVSKSDCDLEDHVREHLLEDHYEDAADRVDFEKVRQASALLFEACQRVKSYQQDMSVVVILREGEEV